MRKDSRGSGGDFLKIKTNYIGIGIRKVFYRNVFLGFFDEKHLRNKEKSVRLETNLV